MLFPEQSLKVPVAASAAGPDATREAVVPFNTPIKDHRHPSESERQGEAEKQNRGKGTGAPTEGIEA